MVIATSNCCNGKGQQIWLDAKADGDSPDERGVVAGAMFSCCEHRIAVCGFMRLLIPPGGVHCFITF